MNAIVIGFCFFMAVMGFLLIAIPRKKAKSHSQIGLLYSIFFLLAGSYMVYSVRFAKVAWQKTADNTYYAKCTVFENAHLFVLEPEDIRLFMENEDTLMEMYAANGVRCIKQATSRTQEQFCRRILKDCDGNYDYSVLVVSKGKTSCIYLIYSREIYTWCYREEHSA